MNRGEGATAFAVMAGTMFLLSVMGPLFAYAFKPSGHDLFLLVSIGLLGLANAGALYGLSLVLQQMASSSPAVQAPEASADPRAELLEKPGGKAFTSPQELMSSIRTLIELENWKLAHQRATELVQAFPKSEESAKVKKNLEYLQKKAAG